MKLIENAEFRVKLTLRVVGIWSSHVCRRPLQIIVTASRDQCQIPNRLEVAVRIPVEVLEKQWNRLVHDIYVRECGIRGVQDAGIEIDK